MRRRILAALTPPGSIGAEVSLLQDGLYAGFGSASSLALPPLVPLGFLEDAPSGRAWDGAGRGLGGRLRISPRQAAWWAGHLWLALDTGGIWSALKSGLAAADPGPDGPDLPAFEGFWLGCSEIAGDPDAAGRALRKAVPGPAFTSCSLAVLAVECASGGNWWREVYWEVVREKPLRGKPAAG
jgi:hypothetical protein